MFRAIIQFIGLAVLLTIAVIYLAAGAAYNYITAPYENPLIKELVNQQLTHVSAKHGQPEIVTSIFRTTDVSLEKKPNELKMVNVDVTNNANFSIWNVGVICKSKHVQNFRDNAPPETTEYTMSFRRFAIVIKSGETKTLNYADFDNTYQSRWEEFVGDVGTVSCEPIYDYAKAEAFHNNGGLYSTTSNLETKINANLDPDILDHDGDHYHKLYYNGVVQNNSPRDLKSVEITCFIGGNDNNEIFSSIDHISETINVDLKSNAELHFKGFVKTQPYELYTGYHCHLTNAW